jgi:alpha-beta hydrolase superfamily lysophospholipase
MNYYKRGKKKMTDYTLKRKDKANIAYTWIKGKQNLAILYLHGWTACRKSPKAEAILKTAQENGCHYISLDYTAHGESGGNPSDFMVGQGLQDTLDVLNKTVKNTPLIIVGNSIGGWIGLLLLTKLQNILGFIGLAPAPDITQFVWDSLLPPQAKEAIEQGTILGPNQETFGFCFTKQLFEDGKKHFILNREIPFNGSVRLIIGDKDNRVDVSRLCQIKDALTSEDITLTLIKGANHHLSEKRDLKIIASCLSEMIGEEKDD